MITIGTTPTSTTAAAPPTSGALRVVGNDWRGLRPPAFGGWAPTAAVSVVIPYYDKADELELTLAALTNQTYPDELLDVVVVDDGSELPPSTGAAGDLGVTIVRQERRGFGAARARNLGVANCRGEIVLFLDADMVPEPWWVEAHARWHHTVADAVTIGFRRHVDFTGIGAEDVRAGADSVERLVGARSYEAPAYIDGHLQRTADLTSDHDDLFRVVASGNLGMRVSLFEEVGGFDASFDQWGGEDVELGYRLFTAGAVLIPDRAALAWHQGAGTFLSAEAERGLAEQRARLEHLVANRGFRRTVPGRSYVVPRVLVTVDVGDRDPRAVTRTVESILGGEVADVTVALVIPEDHPDLVLIRRSLGPDPRIEVVVGTEDVPVDRAIPFRVELPASAVLHPSTMRRVVELLSSPAAPLGVLRSTIPGIPPSRSSIRAVNTRAWERAARALEGGTSGAIEDLAADLFGSRWVSGEDIGVAAHGNDPAPAAGMGEHGTPALHQLVAELPPGQRDALMEFAQRALVIRRSLRGSALRHHRRRTALALRRSISKVVPRAMDEQITAALSRWRARK